MTSLATSAVGAWATETMRSLPRVLPQAEENTDWVTHRHRHGPVPYRGGRGLLVATLEAAGLTGRGGAGFPTARKWRAVADGRGPAVVVGNAAEGEPASGKDRVLLEASPHLVLDGLQLAAEAVAAREAVLYVHPEPWLQRHLEARIAERGDDRFPVQLVPAADRFLAGEESAVVDALEGGVGLPRSTPPRVFERGVGGRATLVQNIETLAHVALLGRYGVEWFRGVGTDTEPGSMLTTLHRPGGAVVAEVAAGTPLRDLVDLSDAQAVLLGGYHGTWLGAADARRTRYSRESLGDLGATPGAGVVVPLPVHACGVLETSRVMTYLAAESAGQCGPCLNGLPRIAVAVEDLARGRAGRDQMDALRRWAGLVERRGACHHPDGTVRFLRSALTVFAGEVERHLSGRCSRQSDARVLPIPGGPR